MNVCPIANVNAPLERTWSLLANPSAYACWWEAETWSIIPEGAAHAGQQVFAQTRFAGMWLEVRIVVRRVDAAGHQIDLTTSLPFGITVDNHIVAAPIDDAHTRVTFG